MSETLITKNYHFNFFSIEFNPGERIDCVRQASRNTIDIMPCRDPNCNLNDCKGKKYHCPPCQKSDDVIQKFPCLVKKHLDKVH